MSVVCVAKIVYSSVSEMFERAPVPDENTRVPVVVTALSSTHFIEAMHMLENVTGVMRGRYDNFKIIIYDIGLTYIQRKMVRTYVSRGNVLTWRFFLGFFMDNIWYRNPSKSEVIDRCGGDEKTE